MAVRSYAKSQANTKAFLAKGKRCEHFTVSEFASPDGKWPTKIDEHLVAQLEKIRDYFGGKVVISSGYRSPSYNASLSGAYTASRHTKGLAADVIVYYKNGKKIPPKEVMLYLWRTGWKEGGIMSSATHVGYRTDYKYFMEERKGSTKNGYPQIKDVPAYFDMRYQVTWKVPLNIWNTYKKKNQKSLGTKKKGSKVYFEKVFTNGGIKWGRISSGHYMKIKTQKNTCMKNV